MVVASVLRQPQVQLPTPHAPPQCHPPVCSRPRCSRCWLPGRNARLQPTTRYRPCHSPPATPVRRPRTHIGQHTRNASLLGVKGRCLTSSGPTSPATSSHPPPPVPKRGTAAIHPRSCRGSRPTPATWLRTTRLGPTHEQPTGTSRPTPTWRTQHNEGVAARRCKRMPHYFPSWTPLLFGPRKPSTPGVPTWPTRKQAIHHHPVPRRHHLWESPFQDLAPPPPSAPYSPNRQPLPVPSRSWPLRRPPRSLCPIRDFTEPSRAFGTSYSQDVPGGRSPSHHQHTTDQPQHRTFHPSRWPPHRGDGERPHLVGWHATSNRHNPALTSYTRWATTQARRAIYRGRVAGCEEEEGTDLPGTHREPSLPTCGARNWNGGPMEWRSIHVCQTTGPSQSTTSPTAFANIPSSSPHLPMDRFAQPCRHARLRGQLARPRLLKPHQRGGKPAHPQPGARRSTPPRHRSQPPSSQPAPKEPRQPGDWPVKQSWSETHAEKGARKKKIKFSILPIIFLMITLTWQPPPNMSWWGSLEVK